VTALDPPIASSSVEPLREKQGKLERPPEKLADVHDLRDMAFRMIGVELE
jgi:hypothetical protein